MREHIRLQWEVLNLLSSRAKGHGDDRFSVTLQRAGASSDGPHAEHSLRLVHHRKHLLSLQAQSLYAGAQRRHHLCIFHEEQKGHWFLLWPDKNTSCILYQIILLCIYIYAFAV